MQRPCGRKDMLYMSKGDQNGWDTEGRGEAWYSVRVVA